MSEPPGELCWGQDTAAELTHQQRTGFTFRSVLRIQMKVQTLGLLGHFSTMNPPGPFSPLRGIKSKTVLWGAPHRSCASSCSSSHPLRLAARTRAQRGKSRCAECPGRYLLWLQAHEQARQGRFPTGALAVAVPGLLQGCGLRSSLCLWTVPAQPDAGSSPRGGF